MLSIYRIPDSLGDEELKKRVGHMSAEQFLGAIDMVEHKSLSCVFKDPKGFDLHFFQDTRLRNKQVETMLAICKECQSSLEKSGNSGNIVYKKLMKILEMATAKREGIVAIAD